MVVGRSGTSPYASCYGLLDFYEQFSHLFGPRLFVALVDEAEVTQGMSVAERMKDVVRLEVGTVGIVDDNACAFGQDADGKAVRTGQP